MSNKLSKVNHPQMVKRTMEQVVAFHNFAQLQLVKMTGTKRTVFEVRLQRAFDGITPLIKKYVRKVEKTREALASIDDLTKMYQKRVIGRNERSGQDIEDFVFTREASEQLDAKMQALLEEVVDVEPFYIPKTDLIPQNFNNFEIRLLEGFVISSEQLNDILYTPHG